jgi:hypothetical protein
MATLIGDVSLTNKTGVFLGEVNLANLNANSNDLVYSPNGFDLSGLAIDDGLEIVGGIGLKTIGNPAIQLTSNSIFVNKGVNTIQSAVDAAGTGDTIYVSSGSFSEGGVVINDKNNISLISPATSSSTLCEILNGLSIGGTSQTIRVSNVQVQGETCNLAGTGRHVFSNVVFQGEVGNVLDIDIGENTTNFMTFVNCEFDANCLITVNAAFANVVYFINCNFNGAALSLLQTAAVQVILNNCAGLLSFTAKATYVGVNVLADGTTIQMNANRYVGVKSFVLSSGVDTLASVNQALFTDGANGFKLVNVPASTLYFNDSYSGQYTITASALAPTPLTLFQKVNQLNVIAGNATILNYSLNFSITGGTDILTLQLIDDDDASVLASHIYTIGTGAHTLAGQFNFTMPGSSFNYSIVGSIVTHTISYNPNMAYGITIQQQV